MHINLNKITEKQLAIILWAGIMLVLITLVSLFFYTLYLLEVNYQLSVELINLKKVK